jgi:hypothetical protein
MGSVARPADDAREGARGASSELGLKHRSTSGVPVLGSPIGCFLPAQCFAATPSYPNGLPDHRHCPNAAIDKGNRGVGQILP